MTTGLPCSSWLRAAQRHRFRAGPDFWLRQGCNTQVLRLFLRVYGAFDWDSQVLTVQGGLPLAAILQHKNGVRRGSCMRHHAHIVPLRWHNAPAFTKPGMANHVQQCTA